MRRSLLWLLGATVLASVAALIVQRPITAVVQAVDTKRITGDRRAALAADDAVAAKPPLPAALPRWDIEPARRDPFADTPAAVTPVPTARPPVAQAVIAPPPPPAPPAMTWRYLGAMDAPDGKRLVMLGRPTDTQAVIVERGTRLEDGYEVLAVSTEAIRLVYAPLQYEVVIAIPTPPASDR